MPGPSCRSHAKTGSGPGGFVYAGHARVLVLEVGMQGRHQTPFSTPRTGLVLPGMYVVNRPRAQAALALSRGWWVAAVAASNRLVGRAGLYQGR